LTNNPPEKFVFISTGAVYGLISGNLISENAPLLANDPYGKSKILAEEILRLKKFNLLGFLDLKSKKISKQS
jgi:UDP-glucose 4-epimerase